MKFHHKIFLILSIVLLISDVAVIWINCREIRAEHERSLADAARRVQNFFNLGMFQTEATLKSLAAYIAHDYRIQQGFLAGKKAVAAEGGGAGGKRAAETRANLLLLVEDAWSRLRERSDFRQLHFHLGPGSTSFLRVHRPERFGDNMDTVRHTIVAANRELRATSGFETGRIISGIRGVEPVFALDPETGVRVHAGALEAGISFQMLLDRLKAHCDTNLAVFLTLDHLRGNVWPEFMAEMDAVRPPVGAFFIEATTTPAGDAMTADLLTRLWGTLGGGLVHETVMRDGRSWSVAAFPLRDFLGLLDPKRTDVGMVVAWRDDSANQAALRKSLRRLMFVAISAWIMVEIFLYAAVCFGREIMARAEAREPFYRRSVRGVLSFLVGAMLLGAVSVFQKIQIGIPLTWQGLWIPSLVGGGFGWAFGGLIYKLSWRTRELKRALAERISAEQVASRHSQSLAAIQDTILVISPELKTLWTNRAARETFGDRPEVFIEPCYRFFKHNDEPCEECPARKAMADGKTHQSILSFRDGEDNVVWRLNRAHPYYDEQGRIAGAIEIISDYTEQKRLIDALAESESIMTQAQAVAGVGSWHLDIPRHVLTWSDETYRIFGIDKHTPLTADLFRDRIHPEDLPMMKTTWKKALAGATYDIVHRIVVGGEERWVNEKARISFDAEGAPLEALGVIHDITDRKRAEDAVRKSEERYRTLINTMQEGLIEVDADWGMIFVNDRFLEMSGYRRDQLIGKSFHDIVSASDRTKARNAHAIRRKGRTGAYELELVRADGGTFHALCSPNPSYDAEGKYLGGFGVITDITERKAMEAERLSLEIRQRQVEKAESLSRMAGAVAHHFNNMLAVIMGNLELAKETLPPKSDASKNLSEIEQAAMRAADMSGLMLSFLGQQQGRPEPVDLAQALKQRLRRLRTQFPKAVILEIDLPDTGPVIDVDPSQFHRVLSSLLTNAWEAMGGVPGRVRVSAGTILGEEIDGYRCFPVQWVPAADADVYAFMMVADTGCGMDAETIGRIFDPFYTDKFTGRGLGLPVALGIVKSFGGCIAVESEPGRGSVFRVIWPLSSRMAPLSVVPGPKTLSKIAGGLVLVVDDEEIVRKVAADMLRYFGFEVIGAGSGFEAVDLFRRRANDIRLVLTDMSMPRMDGWEVMTAMRGIRPDVPVIMASGYDEVRIMAERPGEPPDGFLQKPYLMANLKQVLTDLSGGRAA